MSLDTPFFTDLRSRIARLGGLFNAHLHLDRSGTLHATIDLLGQRQSGGSSSLSLAEKHSIIPLVHGSACYEKNRLVERVSGYLDLMQRAGTTRADTLVDVTDDGVGLDSFEALSRMRTDRSGGLDLRLGAYSPLGFRDDEPRRWELLQAAARRADFIGSLPERDDQADYPGHIGFDEHCRRMVELAACLGKPLHVHVDQKNLPHEDATERIILAVQRAGLPRPCADDEPWLWLVHVISPSTYEEPRFHRLLEGLAEWNIGVICCPSAAISMRQFRHVLTPTFNSIARVLDLLDAGIWVRLGSDNICDITSPAGTPDLVDELFVLCNALRFYEPEVLARLAAGQPLDAAERRLVRSHLAQEQRASGAVKASSVLC